MNFKLMNNVAGWLVFAIAAVVFFYSLESTGSLWDCGEFVAGAQKLQVVHPPGAPLFLLIGRLFVMVGKMFSNAPETAALSVNLMSGLCTAFSAMFICWVTSILGKMMLVGRDEDVAVKKTGNFDSSAIDGESATNSRTMSLGQIIATCGGGIVGGLCSAFISSNWFSAVEGEVYAMSTFFTCLTIWSIVKWYHLPNTPKADRWLIFAIYASALSIGVHLLSLLTFPALALFYYFKKYREHTVVGVISAGLIGVLLVVAMQACIVIGLPRLWASLELTLVNDLGLPVFSGLLPLALIIGSIIFFGLRETAKEGDASTILKTIVGLLTTLSIYAVFSNVLGALLALGVGVSLGYLYNASFNSLTQKILVAFTVSVIGYSVIGMVVIRANANTPINMNQPSDPLRLLPYLNREQYGSRPLFRGPNFNAEPSGSDTEDRYGRVGNKYEVVSQKVDYVFDDADKVLFPRMGDYQEGREQQYRAWMSPDEGQSTRGKRGEDILSKRNPTFGDNVSFFISYQVGWMYWRYFMWNFVGRQNGEQGYTPADKTSGNWISGIKSIDESHLYNQSELTTAMKNDAGRNTYYFIPLILGLIGIFFHLKNRPKEFLSLLGLFVITGIGIIVYTNQTPQEPRERDYVLVGSFFTFCIWIGLAVPGLYSILSKKISGSVVAPVLLAAALSAPYLLCTQNYDDHGRRGHTGARDYASNFLNSVKQNAIIFTYGDNDTYPLWYAQEAEGIRPDVRVVNLSLIAVDWYIEQLRRKTNASDAIKLSIPSESYRGSRRDQTPVYGSTAGQVMNLNDALKYVGEKHPMSGGRGMTFESTLPTTNFTLPVDLEKMKANGLINPLDTGVLSAINFSIGADRKYIIKDDLAILDLIASNINERPIYFAVTCQQNKLQGLQDFMQLEGLALRVVPIKSKSDQQFSIIGNGRVDTQSAYENITKKFVWGNFDKEKLFVDRSYAPSVQSHRFVLLRTAMALVEQGKKKEAVDILDTYFKGFPNMNFTYDYNSFYLITTYVQADAYDKAKPHLETLAKNTIENLKFYKSIGDEINNGFKQDYAINLRTMKDMIDLVKRAGDTNYAQQLEKDFEPYDITKDMKGLQQLQQ